MWTGGLSRRARNRSARSAYLGATRNAETSSVHIQGVTFRVVVTVIRDPASRSIQGRVSVDIETFDGRGGRAQRNDAVIVVIPIRCSTVVRSDRTSADRFIVNSKNARKNMWAARWQGKLRRSQRSLRPTREVPIAVDYLRSL